jgi:hypothetical protein
VTRKRAAARGEILETPEARDGRRFWFQLEDVQVKWLPLSETAFLLWVLAGLVLVWLVVALVLVLV